MKGFTLIELSIVLIIISLIVAGVTGGKSLIHAAELQSVIADVNKYKTAYNNFILQYDAKPGDIPNAEDYWPADCIDAGNNTCNGNNTGYIGDGISGSEEALRAWQHLGLSGLIPGKYTGDEYTTPDSKIGINVPPSKLKGAGYELKYFTSSGLYGIQANFLWLGAEFFTLLLAPVLSPVDAQTIDKKIDDGEPTTGKVLARGNLSVDCVDASNKYKVSNNNIDCSMFFVVD